MSDALLERIAAALEKLAFVHANVPATVSQQPAAVAVSTGLAAPAGVEANPNLKPKSKKAAAPTAAPSGADLFTQVADTLMDLANNYSRDTAIALLAKYGAQKANQVKPEHQQALLNDLFAAIAQEKAKAANASLL